MMPRLLFIAFLLVFRVSCARPGLKKPSSPRSAGFQKFRREALNTTACGSATTNEVKAPQENIFLGLTNDESAAVTAFLHDQPSLNLTGVANATDWDNILLLVEFLQPNKSDALAYLDSNSKRPDRYARARIQFGATLEPYIQEFMVGPLPVTNGTTSVQPLNYIFNKGEGRFNAYGIDTTALLAYLIQVAGEVSDITQRLFNATVTGSANDTIFVTQNDNFMHENGRVYVWTQFNSVPTGAFISTDLLPLGLEFRVDVTGRDPSKWSVDGWWYNGVYALSLDEFRKALGDQVTIANLDGPWTSTDQAGLVLPRDDLYPPLEIAPDVSRFGVDSQAKYVEWMDFSFYISFSRDTGVQLNNIKYKGERIIYELALQEAVAHYASADPFQSTTSYLDSYYGLGLLSFELVAGFDCPSHASYLDVTFYEREQTHTHPKAICMFEHDTGYPAQRHLTSFYVSSTKNIVFTLRSISVVGNYDYVFDFDFHLDGSIFVTVRASGYIQGAFWANDPEYGFHIHDWLSGSMHDHVLNYKLDLDVHGTKNSLMKTTVVPATVVYPWANGMPRNTMKMQREFIKSEDQSQINFAGNGVDFYAVVNKDQPNLYGEYPGWRLQAQNTIHSTTQDSANLGPSFNFGYKDMYVVKQKDTEPRSAYPYNGYDTRNPVVDFGKFLDGDSLDQEDLVVYFNLGMHHLPHTGDLPNTVTTTARSTMAIIPQNYLLSDPSRQTIHQVRLNIPLNGTVATPMLFGAKQPTCLADLAHAVPDISSYSGEVLLPKYPYDPNAVSIVLPGGGATG